MNAKNSVISDPTSDRISLKSRDKYVPSSNFSIYYTQKNIKKGIQK